MQLLKPYWSTQWFVKIGLRLPEKAVSRFKQKKKKKVTFVPDAFCKTHIISWMENIMTGGISVNYVGSPYPAWVHKRNWWCIVGTWAPAILKTGISIMTYLNYNGSASALWPFSTTWLANKFRQNFKRYYSTDETSNGLYKSVFFWVSLMIFQGIRVTVRASI